MPHFRTPIAPHESSFALSHQDSLLCIGSCFAQNIAHKLQELKFNSLLNPFGILYNPESICKLFDRLLSDQPYQAEDLFQHQGLWHSFDHHGSFSGTARANTLENINTSLEEARSFLARTNRLLLTLGTAYVFEHIDSKSIVANCHKLANTSFHRKRLSQQEIQERLAQTLNQLKERNPQLEIIISLSPIRHIRDGHIENQRSKASLILAIDHLEKSYDFVHYFPAYEIVLDDLRDYRFYAEDMLHPNSIAIEYIWKYFSEGYFSTKTKELIQQIEAISQASQHRALHPSSAPHQQFIQQQLAKIDRMKAQFEFLDFSTEIAAFEQQIVS